MSNSCVLRNLRVWTRLDNSNPIFGVGFDQILVKFRVLGSHIERTVNTLWLGDMIFQNFPKISPSKKSRSKIFFAKWKFLEIFLFSDNIIVWRSRLVLQKCAEPTPTYRNQLSFFQFTLLPFINPWCRWHLLEEEAASGAESQRRLRLARFPGYSPPVVLKNRKILLRVFKMIFCYF